MTWCKQKRYFLSWITWQGTGDLTCKWGEDKRVKPLSTHNSKAVSNEPKLEMLLQTHTSNVCLKKTDLHICPKYALGLPYETEISCLPAVPGNKHTGPQTGVSRWWICAHLPAASVYKGSAPVKHSAVVLPLRAVGQQSWCEAFLPPHRPCLEEQSALEDLLAQLVPINLLPQIQGQGNLCKES